MRFSEKLDLLMQIFRMNNVRLARGIGVDPSLVSRWRSGDRTPSEKSSAALDIGAFLSGAKMLPLDAALLRQTLGIGEQSREELAASITGWLRADHIVSIESEPVKPPSDAADAYMGAAGIVGQMARLLDYPVPEQTGPVNLWPYVQRGNPAEHEIFTGEKGKRKAVLSFLHKLQSSPRPLDVFLTTGRNDGWMYGDADFPELWRKALLALLQKGHRLHIVLSGDELDGALKTWLRLPLFFTPQCFVYALPHRLADTLLVAQGHAAVLSYGVGPTDEVTFLFSGIMDSSTFDAVFRHCLHDGGYLVLHTVQDVPALHEKLCRMENLPGAAYLARNTLSAVFLPEPDLDEVFSLFPIPDKSKKLALHAARRTRMAETLKSTVWAEVISVKTLREAAQGGGFYLDGTEFGLEKDIPLTRVTLARLLGELIQAMLEYDNLHILLLETDPLPIRIFYKQSFGAYFAPARKHPPAPGRPAAAFAGMPQELENLERWFTAHKYNREETLVTLGEIVRSCSISSTS